MPSAESKTGSDSSRKRSLSLELFGHHFTVVSDTDERRVRDIVDFVNRRLEEIRDSSKRIQTDQIALLASLNLAEELFKLRDQNEALKRTVRERSRRLLRAIDGVADDLDLELSRSEGPS